MSIFKCIEMAVKQRREERLYQEDYTRTMKREYKRLEEERVAKEQAQKEQEEMEQKIYEEYLLEYERDSIRLGF